MTIGFNPFSFLQEKEGALVHQIFPTRGLANSSSSNGRIEFKPHVDGAYLDRAIRPETLSLICMNNDAKTSTILTSIDDILNKLNGDGISLLSSSEFIHISPETFGLKNGFEKTKSSILDKLDGNWEVKIAIHNTEPCSPKSKWALDKFIAASSMPSTSINWLPGDFVIFNNFRCLHGRSEIRGKRWLKRCYGSKHILPGTVIDLHKIQKKPNSHYSQ